MVEDGKEGLPFDLEELERSLPARFARIAARYPDRPALKIATRTWTYAELDRDTNRLARLILERTGRHPGIAGFLIGQEGPQTIAILGALKAGKAYLPLDPEQPAARNRFMLEDTEAELLLTDQAHAAAGAELIGADRRLNLEDPPAGPADEDPGLRYSPDDLANILFTSGSTGQPKGVMNNHRNMLLYSRNVGQLFGFHPRDRIAHLISCTFTYAIATTLGALFHGACLLPFDLKRRGLPALAKWLAEEGITVLCTNPAILRQLALILPGRTSFPQMRVLVTSGEAIFRRDVEQLRRLFPADCSFYNMYGATESPNSSDYLIPWDFAGEEAVPIGYPVWGKQLLIMGEDGRELSPGEIGEIYFRSVYISSGYWRRPELSAAAFPPVPDGGPERLYRSGDLGRKRIDGCLEYHGRRDDMVKISGHRIELGEIEGVLRRLPAVLEAVVLAKREAGADPSLTAYVVARPESGQAGIGEDLARILPVYMIPRRFIFLDAMPRNANGKIDRRALPELGQERAEQPDEPIAGRDENERKLAEIFARVLKKSPVGIRDDFFALGGDSLSYLWLMAEVEREFGADPPLEELAGALTIERLAALLKPSADGENRLPEAKGQRPEHGGPPLSRFLVSSLAGYPYGKGAARLAAIAGRRWIRRCFFKREAALVRGVLAAAIGGARLAEDEALAQAIAANLGFEWRCVALSRCAPEEFAGWVSVSGYDHFTEAAAKGTGVMLITSHYCLAMLVPLVLRGRGFEDLQIIIRFPALLKQMGLEDDFRRSGGGSGQSGTALLSGQLYRGRRTIRRGGAVLLSADGDFGSSQDLRLPFLGRERSFKTGFAELALEAGTPIIPVSLAMARDGRCAVNFLPEIEPAGTSREERVASLVRQYVEILARQWREGWWNFHWQHLKLFLRSPHLTEPGGESPDG